MRSAQVVFASVLLLGLAASLSCSPAAPPPASVVYSSFVGGDLWDAVRDVALDDAGYVYVAGGTRSDRFLPGSTPKASADDSNDAFVAKIDPDGERVIWAKTFGGPGYDQAYALEIAPDGGILVGGRGGAGFPTTAGAAQREFQGGPEPREGRWYGTQDGIAFKLSPDGELRWATYVGCAGANDFLRDIAVTPDGAVVAGTASDGNGVPTALTEAFERGPHSRFAGGNRDAVVAVISPDGSKFEWAAYVGGSGDEWAEVSVRSDDAGNVVILTVTNSGDAPVLSALQPTLAGEWDFYLAKFSRAGVPVFATYLGGSGPEHIETHHLAIAPGGDVVVGAGTQSMNYPVTAGAFQQGFAGAGGRRTGYETNYPGDAVVSRVSSDGARLVASTYVGGRHGDSAEGVAVDERGRVFLTGASYSSDFPTLPNVSWHARDADAFALALSPDLRQLLGSVRLGGEGGQALRSTAVSRDGRRLVAGGETATSSWPLRGELDATFAGPAEGVLAGVNLLGESSADKQ